MNASEIRKEARKNLSGRWGKAAIITLVYVVITFVIQFILELVPLVGLIALSIIEIPISYGIIATFMRLKRGEDVSAVNFLSEGFSKFSKSWSVTLNMIKKLFIPIIITIVCLVVGIIGGFSSLIGATAASSSTGSLSALVVIGLIAAIIAGIYTAIKSLYYSLSLFILKDNENMSGSEIVEKSEELMQGNRWNLFWLTLTFIGWMILAAIPLGLGYFWLIPYIQIAQVIFYEDRAGILNTKQEDTNIDIAEENNEQ